MYMFTPAALMPPDAGVAIFSRVHLAWLCAALVALVLTCRFFSKHKSYAKTFLRVSGAALAFFELARPVLLAACGGFNLSGALPLHLCGAMAFVTFAAARTDSPILWELCWCLGMPGGLFAMLTPGETSYPFFNIFYIQFILSHFLLAVVPMVRAATGFRPRAARLPWCFCLLAAYAGLCDAVNTLTGANYMFLNVPSDGSPLEAFAALGNWYTAGLVLCVLTVWAILYMGQWVVEKVRSRTARFGDQPNYVKTQCSHVVFTRKTQ